MPGHCWDTRPPLFRNDPPAEDERPRLPEPSGPTWKAPERKEPLLGGSTAVSNGNGGFV